MTSPKSTIVRDYSFQKQEEIMQSRLEVSEKLVIRSPKPNGIYKLLNTCISSIPAMLINQITTYVSDQIEAYIFDQIWSYMMSMLFQSSKVQDLKFSTHSANLNESLNVSSVTDTVIAVLSSEVSMATNEFEDITTLTVDVKKLSLRQIKSGSFGNIISNFTMNTPNETNKQNSNVFIISVQLTTYKKKNQSCEKLTPNNRDLGMSTESTADCETKIENSNNFSNSNIKEKMEVSHGTTPKNSKSKGLNFF